MQNELIGTSYQKAVEMASADLLDRLLLSCFLAEQLRKGEAFSRCLDSELERELGKASPSTFLKVNRGPRTPVSELSLESEEELSVTA